MSDENFQKTNFGLVTPGRSSSLDVVLTDNWAYLPPTGGSPAPYRLTDFEMYYHQALPPITSPGDITFYTTLVNSVTIMAPQNLGGRTSISLSDLVYSGITDMYFAVILEYNGAEWIKTSASTIGNGGASAGISVSKLDGPFITNTNKNITCYLVACDTRITTMQQTNTQATQFMALPFAEAGDSRITLKQQIGTGLVFNPTKIATGSNAANAATGIYFDVWQYTGISIENERYFPVNGSGTIAMEFTVRNTLSTSRILSGSFFMRSSKSLYDQTKETGDVGASLFDNKGNAVSNINVAAGETITLRVVAPYLFSYANGIRGNIQLNLRTSVDLYIIYNNAIIGSTPSIRIST